jgi:hypothetical protein
MVDGLFFISSALNVKQLSVFSNEERFQQTVETIKSIDKYCPSNVKYLFDSSYEKPNEEYLNELSSMGVKIFYVGDNRDVKMLSESGQRSLAETLGFILFLNLYVKEPVVSKRIYKISGRYKLNDDFILDREDFKSAFVFSKLWDSWMSKEQQERVGIKNMIALRLWHMDANLFDNFNGELYNILDLMIKYKIDVEHAYYKILSKFKIAICEPIGVSGVIAPTGEIINE